MSHYTADRGPVPQILMKPTPQTMVQPTEIWVLPTGDAVRFQDVSSIEIDDGGSVVLWTTTSHLLYIHTPSEPSAKANRDALIDEWRAWQARQALVTGAGAVVSGEGGGA